MDSTDSKTLRHELVHCKCHYRLQSFYFSSNQDDSLLAFVEALVIYL